MFAFLDTTMLLLNFKSFLFKDVLHQKKNFRSCIECTKKSFLLNWSKSVFSRSANTHTHTLCLCGSAHTLFSLTLFWVWRLVAEERSNKRVSFSLSLFVFLSITSFVFLSSKEKKQGWKSKQMLTSALEFVGQKTEGSVAFNCKKQRPGGCLESKLGRGLYFST